jgi:hypothetical protein
MLAEANAAVPRPNPAELRDMIGKGDVAIVDVPDTRELAAGRASSRRRQIRRFRRTRLSWSIAAPTGRAALSGNALKALGYQSIYNAGGFKELADAGLEIEPA